MDESKFKELQQKIITAKNDDDNAHDALAELHRMGAKLKKEHLRELMTCDCGPSGEHPIESWPCV